VKPIRNPNTRSPIHLGAAQICHHTPPFPRFHNPQAAPLSAASVQTYQAHRRHRATPSPKRWSCRSRRWPKRLSPQATAPRPRVSRITVCWGISSSTLGSRLCRANAAGRVDQCKVNPAYAQDLGGFKFRCDFAIVNEEADLPAAPVTMVKYKTIPGFCPVPLRVKQEWTTVAEPSLQENSGEDEAPAYIGTDQLHLQWLINPATPLTSLSFLINPTTAIAHAINQKSKPPGVWNADQGKLMWTVIAPDHETLPDQLMARFQMKSSAPTGDSEVHRAQPVSARLEGKRNRPITDLQFSFAVISPDSDQPTPAEVKGGVIGKFISNAYTFC